MTKTSTVEFDSPMHFDAARETKEPRKRSGWTENQKKLEYFHAVLFLNHHSIYNNSFFLFLFQNLHRVARRATCRTVFATSALGSRAWETTSTRAGAATPPLPTIATTKALPPPRRPPQSSRKMATTTTIRTWILVTITTTTSIRPLPLLSRTTAMWAPPAMPPQPSTPLPTPPMLEWSWPRFQTVTLWAVAISNKEE